MRHGPGWCSVGSCWYKITRCIWSKTTLGGLQAAGEPCLSLARASPTPWRQTGAMTAGVGTEGSIFTPQSIPLLELIPDVAPNPPVARDCGFTEGKRVGFPVVCTKSGIKMLSYQHITDLVSCKTVHFPRRNGIGVAWTQDLHRTGAEGSGRAWPSGLGARTTQRENPSGAGETPRAAG